MSLQESSAALDLFNKHADNPDALRLIAFYFLTTFPEHAENSVKAWNVFVPDNKIEVVVPAGENQFGSWAQAKYRLPLEQVRFWNRIYNDESYPGFGGKVAAIKQCRADTGLSLKEAKDLCEYLATKEW